MQLVLSPSLPAAHFLLTNHFSAANEKAQKASTEKKEINGVSYDYVWNVDLGDGQQRFIGHNVTGNPSLLFPLFFHSILFSLHFISVHVSLLPSSHLGAA